MIHPINRDKVIANNDSKLEEAILERKMHSKDTDKTTKLLMKTDQKSRVGKPISKTIKAKSEDINNKNSETQIFSQKPLNFYYQANNEYKESLNYQNFPFPGKKISSNEPAFLKSINSIPTVKNNVKTKAKTNSNSIERCQNCHTQQKHTQIIRIG